TAPGVCLFLRKRALRGSDSLSATGSRTRPASTSPWHRLAADPSPEMCRQRKSCNDGLGMELMNGRLEQLGIFSEARVRLIAVPGCGATKAWAHRHRFATNLLGHSTRGAWFPQIDGT